jgi:hypothetical protein
MKDLQTPTNKSCNKFQKSTTNTQTAQLQYSCVHKLHNYSTVVFANCTIVVQLCSEIAQLQYSCIHKLHNYSTVVFTNRNHLTFTAAYLNNNL